MKTIWILNHYASMNGGRHYKYAENLIKRGYSVKVFRASTVHNTNQNLITDSSKKYTYREANNIPFVIVRARNYVGNGKQRLLNMVDYAQGLLSVTKYFDDEKPDIIYSSSVHPLTWLAGYRLAKRYNAKFIAETRDLWPETLVAMGRVSKNSIPAKILYKIERFIYKKADKLIFTFPGGKDYVESIGLDTSKVRYINNGIDLEEFNHNKVTYILEDRQLDDSGIFKVLFTGAIGKANALYRIVDVARIFIDKGITDIKFYIYGDGPEKDNLQNYVLDNNIKNVIFKGRVDKKYIPYILSKGDLNVLCLEHLPNLFKYGLSPNKMFDYFASGRPIVSNVECGYDMLEKYRCGITVKGGSAEALAEGILKFYNMPKEEYNIYCKNAFEAARDFDFKILTDKLEKVLLED
ncbi:MAG: glycosyltransferase family 4 protein [Clostridiales bacterium]|nr:glycosyltransferase family 4 protein [Clostridiales bacterium]